jgi:hypothetical protein
MKHPLRIISTRKLGMSHPEQYGYKKDLEISDAYAHHMSNNCAVVIRDKTVWAGPCCKPLVGGACPDHGEVKICQSPTTSPQ